MGLRSVGEVCKTDGLFVFAFNVRGQTWVLIIFAFDARGQTELLIIFVFDVRVHYDRRAYICF
jgi:hypothetical protein